MTTGSILLLDNQPNFLLINPEFIPISRRSHPNSFPKYLPECFWVAIARVINNFGHLLIGSFQQFFSGFDTGLLQVFNRR